MEIENPSILDASEPVSRAINEISRTGLPVIITKDGKYIGIIDERAIRTHTDPSKAKCGSLSERAPALTPESTVMDACNAFFAGRFKAIPVISKGKVEGAITRRTLFRELLGEKMLTKKRVSEVMTTPVHTLDISSSIGQARSEMRRQSIRRVVVTKDGKIAGLLSVFDLATSFSGKMQSSPFYRGGEKTSMDAQPIASYVKKEVETISGSDSLASAVKKMLDARVAALIVEDNGFPHGIVTAKDILHAALAEEKGASRVFVSGIPHDKREYASQIAGEGEKLLARLGKSSPVRSLAYHMKNEGSGFSVRARLDTTRKSYSASSFDFRIESAVRQVTDEIEKMAGKDKLTGMSRKKGVQRARDVAEE
ncbi:MAG: CBS domain-containing protein [Candidatus Micrarchaeota archaeon]|nr:CBS domain-containing protein [Candidatus Micrarchaeota archaeon]